MAAKANHPRPDHAWVGAKTYDILWYNEEEWADNHLNENDCGLTYAGRNHIYMRLMPGATEGNFQEVLLHEITHAIWNETHLTHLNDTLAKDPSDLEETVIGIQSPALLLMLQQNPHIVGYLQADPAARRR